MSMKKAKRFLTRAAALLLAGVMVLSLAGCLGRRSGSGGRLIDIYNDNGSPSRNSPSGNSGNSGNSGHSGGSSASDRWANVPRNSISPAVNADSWFSYWPDDVPMDVRDWPSAEEFLSDYNALADEIYALAASSGNDTALIEKCGEFDDMYMLADVWSTFCYIDYQCDEAAGLSAYSRWNDALSDMYDIDREVYTTLLDSPYHDTIADWIGSGMVNYYTSSGSGNTQLSSLYRQENSLVEQYYNIAGTYSSYNSSRDYDLEIYDIYSQLVAVRQQIAELNGYDSYADYSYENDYGRDFTPDDVDNYYNNVVNYWVPVVDEFEQLVQQYGLATSGGSSCSDEELAAMLYTMESGICGKYADLVDYLLVNDLLYMNSSTDNGGVTVGLSQYDSAVLYASGTDGLGLYSTLVHEFGHFANDCLAPDTYSSYDVLEVHSTGMQVLSTYFAEDLFGDEAADYSAQQIYFLLWYVGSQAATDAFERAVYKHYAETGSMYTYEELNELYGRVFTECGEETDPTMWTEDSFLFEYPCYSLSYSISAATSLSMLATMDDDFSGTAEHYLRLVSQTNVAGYVASMEQSGMPNVLDPDQSSQTAQAVIEYAREFVAASGRTPRGPVSGGPIGDDGPSIDPPDSRSGGIGDISLH